MKKGYKRYGLEGKTISIRMKDLMNPEMLLNSNVIDPWRYGEQQVKVIQETDDYLSVQILPHRAPIAWGMSHIYPTTIMKHDIYTGNVIMRYLNGDRIK